MILYSEADIMKEWSQEGANIPLASICTRTYNLEKYIEQCLDSLLMQQTTFPYEIIIDDDCSTDATVEIVSRYAEKFPHIVKPNFRKQNVGLKLNLMGNLARASGNYIAICDGDDFWTDPLKLQKQVSFLEQDSDEEYVLAICRVLPLYEKGAAITGISCARHDSSAEALLKHTAGINASTACFRNVPMLHSCPEECMFAPIDDHFIWSMLGNYGKGKFLGDIKPVMYRQHPQGDFASKTYIRRMKMNLQTDFMLYLLYDRLDNQKISHYFLRESVKYFIIKFGLHSCGTIYLHYLKGKVIGRAKNIARWFLIRVYPERFPCHSEVLKAKKRAEHTPNG